MHAAVVVPCLNEQETLAATCASLGFGAISDDAPDATLFLVDNGSIDATPAVMTNIQRAGSDRVVLAYESERGYVPPRHRGVIAAKDHFAKKGIASQEILVIQADADTVYSAGYIAALLAAARVAPGVLLEGIAKPLPAFEQQHPGYHRLAEQADSVVEPFLVDEANEIIVDDKVAAYRLGDYFDWGGHRREYDKAGDEIHAETSRLYLRGLAAGARRVRVADAVAFPSRRKVELDPLLYLATAGFPHEVGWLGRWRQNHPAVAPLAAFEQESARETFAEAIFLRQAHTLLLFGFIPAYVAQIFGRPDHRSILRTPLGKLVTSVSDITAAKISSHPGCLFAASFPLVEEHRRVFEECLQGANG